jgi:hypothetical protein
MSVYDENRIALISAGLLEKILSKLEIIESLMEKNYNLPRGTTLTSTIHLHQGEPQTRIDFVDARRHRNIPIDNSAAGAQGRDDINILGVPVTKVILYNLGPGGIHYDTNKKYGDLTVQTPVTANSSWEITSAEWPCIYSINLAAQDMDAKVRLTAIV